MRESQKVESLRPPFTTCLAIPLRVSPELDESCLIRVEHQSELRHAFPHCCQIPHGIVLLLEPNDTIIRISDDGDLSRGMSLPPLMCP